MIKEPIRKVNNKGEIVDIRGEFTLPGIKIVGVDYANLAIDEDEGWCGCNCNRCDDVGNCIYGLLNIGVSVND